MVIGFVPRRCMHAMALSQAFLSGGGVGDPVVRLPAVGLASPRAYPPRGRAVRCGVLVRASATGAAGSLLCRASSLHGAAGPPCGQPPLPSLSRNSASGDHHLITYEIVDLRSSADHAAQIRFSSGQRRRLTSSRSPSFSSACPSCRRRMVSFRTKALRLMRRKPKGVSISSNSFRVRASR